jgi:pimeloyl-ACP methyl ester carboxylesterase
MRMNGGLLVLWACLAVGADPVAVQFSQVSPRPLPAGEWVRTADQRRAVVLIQGLLPHPFNKNNVNKATLRDWQKPGSPLVNRLAADADVYAFGYGQIVAVDEIAEHPALIEGVREVRAMGYREVVVVGYSAGGLIARRLVEEFPDVGVTKVVQVCAPNAGSGWAKLKAVRKNQQPFLESLTKNERRREMLARLDVYVPEGIEFVCIVGTGAWTGDGVVSSRSQWSPDLQAQGIPAVKVPTDHLSMVRGSAGDETIAALVRTPQPRWTQGQVAAARKKILGE